MVKRSIKGRVKRFLVSIRDSWRKQSKKDLAVEDSEGILNSIITNHSIEEQDYIIDSLVNGIIEHRKQQLEKAQDFHERVLKSKNHLFNYKTNY